MVAWIKGKKQWSVTENVIGSDAYCVDKYKGNVFSSPNFQYQITRC